MQRDPDFSSLSDLQTFVAKHRFPADGVYQDEGDHWAVMITFIPGPTYHGVLPKTPEALAWMTNHNWRKL